MRSALQIDSGKGASLAEQENHLQAGLAAGDQSSYQAAYDLYGAALYRTAARMLGSAADAEDAVQEVFASIVRSRQRIAGVANLEAYLFVSLRRAAGRIRRRERFGPTADLDESWMAVRAGEGKGPDESENLRRAVERLPVEQRETLALKIDGQLTFARIGEVLGISPNTAASRYRYALEKLRQVLEKDDDTRNRNAP